MGIPDVSKILSGSDAAIKFALLSSSTELKSSNSEPLPIPAWPPPTSSIRSSSSLDSPPRLPPAHTPEQLSSPFFFHYNLRKRIRVKWVCIINTVSPKLSSVCAKGEIVKIWLSSSSTWLLHDGILFLFSKIHNYVFSSLNILSASSDSTWYSKDTLRNNTRVFLISIDLHFTFCLPLNNCNFYFLLPNFIEL